MELKTLKDIDANEEGLGNGLYMYTAQLTFKAGSSNASTFKAPSEDVWVDNIAVTLTHDKDVILESTATRDIVNIQITDVDNNNYIMGGSSVDLFTLQKLGLSNNFIGFFIPKNRNIKVEAQHIVNTWADVTKDVVVSITFQGRKIKR